VKGRYGGLYLEVTDSIVHIRRGDSRECVGDIERATFEAVRELLRAEFMAEVRSVVEKAK